MRLLLGFILSFIFSSELSKEELYKKYSVKVLQESDNTLMPQHGDKVHMHYLGTLENGKKFDSSYDRGQAFQTAIGVRHVITCWDEVVLTMNVGQKIEVLCPSETAYGSREVGGLIPKNSNLIFQMELLKIEGRPARGEL